jgi:hypothetical protein
MNKTILECALDYASFGWSVFPCHSIRDGKCSCEENELCKKPGKHPRTMNGFKDATTNEAIIKEWWKKWPDANIGCATGEISGIVVLDLDTKHDRTSNEFILPITVCAISGGLGEHFFFEYPGHYVKSTNGELFGPGVDIKGDGGYVILAPSSHISGHCYEWKFGPDDAEIAEIPKWLNDALDKQNDPKKRKTLEKGRRWCTGRK